MPGTAKKLAPKAHELLLGLGPFQHFVQARQRACQEHKESERGALFDRRMQARIGGFLSFLDNSSKILSGVVSNVMRLAKALSAGFRMRRDALHVRAARAAARRRLLGSFSASQAPE